MISAAVVMICCVNVHSFRAVSFISVRQVTAQKLPGTISDSYSRINPHERPSTVLYGQRAVKANLIKSRKGVNPKTATSFFSKFREEFLILLYAPLKRKIIFMVHPLLALLSVYLFFKFLPTLISSAKIFGSRTAAASKIFTAPVTTENKKTGDSTSIKKIVKAPTLTASLAMAKSEDVAVVSRNIVDETRIDARIDIVEETSKMASDASIAQARREIELKLAAIVETEERIKLMRGVNQVQPILLAAQGIVAEAVVVAAPIEMSIAPIEISIVAETTNIPVTVLIAAEEEKEVVKQQSVLEISKNALMAQQPKMMADATAATFFAIAVGSPIFQPVMNFFHQHVHLIK